MTRALAVAAGIAALFALALAFGDRSLPLADVVGALRGDPETPQPVRTIVLGLRLPRAVLALAVGAALGVAGTISQAVLRNPLAEPGLLGINAGAAFAAMLVIVVIAPPSETLLPWLTFTGALGMAGAILILAWREGSSSLRLILIGVGLSAMAGAGASFIATFGEVASVQRAMTWLAGSLQDARWPILLRLLLWSVPPMLVVWIAARELDLIALGDDVARGRGQPVEGVRIAMILACAVISGAAVAAAGLIAFVGLAAPHIARRFAGHGHRRLIPAAGATGAVMVLGADLAARTAIAPMQLPVGLVTALLGAPFFGYLLWRRGHD